MKWSEVVLGKVWGGYQENVLHPEGGWALEQAPQGSGHSTKPGRIQEMFGQCSQAHGVILGVSCSKSWTGVGLDGPYGSLPTQNNL